MEGVLEEFWGVWQVEIEQVDFNLGAEISDLYNKPFFVFRVFKISLILFESVLIVHFLLFY